MTKLTMSDRYALMRGMCPFLHITFEQLMNNSKLEFISSIVESIRHDAKMILEELNELNISMKIKHYQFFQVEDEEDLPYKLFILASAIKNIENNFNPSENREIIVAALCCTLHLSTNILEFINDVLLEA